MTAAQAAFLVALGTILAFVVAFGGVVVVRARRSAGARSLGVLARLGQPSTARLELHRWAFYAHRVSGIGILAFLALHLVDVGLVAFSPALYDEVHVMYGTAPLRVFEVVLLAGILFHALNGLRLVALDIVDVDAAVSERLLWLAIALTVAFTLPVGAIILRPLLP